jgi:hypothetical protein
MDLPGQNDQNSKLVPLNTDLDQNNDPEVAQRGRQFDA